MTRSVDFIYDILRPIHFLPRSSPNASDGLLYSSSRDRAGVIHPRGSLAFLDHLARRHRRALSSITPVDGNSRARDDLQRSTSVQPIGRAAAAVGRPRASSSADNVHRTRVARRQHASTDALAQSSRRAPSSGTRVRAMLPAGERRAREFNVRGSGIEEGT